MSADGFLDRTFFQRDPVTCARELIGCELVWGEAAGMIVETEAYAALDDAACHTFTRPSARVFVEREQAGTAYVYFNYGRYWLLNVLVKGGSADGFVLLRALEPTRGIETMTVRRLGINPRPALHNPNLAWLCSGPGKLALALGVAGRDHGRDLCAGHGVGFRSAAPPAAVVADRRVGISKAAQLPWRFLLRGSPWVSVPLGATKGSPRRKTRAMPSAP